MATLIANRGIDTVNWEAQFSEIDRTIEKTKRSIAQHRALISELKGDEKGDAENVLSIMHDGLADFERDLNYIRRKMATMG